MVATASCVAPDDGDRRRQPYPIARDLFIYVEQGRIDPTSASYNPALAPFVDFYLDLRADASW